MEFLRKSSWQLNLLNLISSIILPGVGIGSTIKFMLLSFRYGDTTVVPKFGKFAGYYVDANGTVTTKNVGPVALWNNLNYDLINPSPTGEYSMPSC